VSTSQQNAPAQADHLFGIGAATQITGIPEATLRVWERRYHFPQALRSPGGHRQYTQQAILQLLWVRLQLDDGMRAGQAIHARLFTERDAAIATALHQPLAASTPPDPALTSVQQSLLERLVADDDARASAILREAAAQHPLQRVVLDVIGPTFTAIGDAWSAGRVAIATEHFATNFLRHQLLAWLRASPPPFQVPPVALVCAPEELHEGSLLMLGTLLRRSHWPVRYLGQMLPLPELGGLVDRVAPALIVFVAMSETSALALAGWPEWLGDRTETQVPIIGYGGRAFTMDPDLAARVPGTLLGSTLEEGWRRMQRLLLHLNVLER
jgi:MerR family transcriptional regulator, light-induced transcriptional regulator